MTKTVKIFLIISLVELLIICGFVFESVQVTPIEYNNYSPAEIGAKIKADSLEKKIEKLNHLQDSASAKYDSLLKLSKRSNFYFLKKYNEEHKKIQELNPTSIDSEFIFVLSKKGSAKK